MISRLLILLCCVLPALGLTGCEDPPQASQAAQQRLTQVNAALRERWGKGLEELPKLALVAISPNNDNIQREFEEAFSLHYALEHGKTVDIEWREVGGGSTAILTFLRNVYSQADTSRIDIVWGGGDSNFRQMAQAGILSKMALPESFIQNVPKAYGGLPMYDPQGYWAGSAISGFGILYNKTLLARMDIAPPETWDDLAKPRFHKMLALADPTKSGSALAAYEMIVQSGGNWPDGWAKLLGVLGNAKRFYDGAGDAANAVVTEAPVATCIDFYGVMRVLKYPDDLVYIAPKGQTAFNPDPIAILKNPPHPELAQAFCDFVLSRRGQALWALPVGAEHGPVHHPLYRTPIRQDVYPTYAGKLMPSIANPFQEGDMTQLDLELWRASFRVLRALVWAAAVTNLDDLQAAKQALDDGNLAALGELPPNAATLAELNSLRQRLDDKAAADEIMTHWQFFFRDLYHRLQE